jgi:hypothetical protein
LDFWFEKKPSGNPACRAEEKMSGENKYRHKVSRLSRDEKLSFSFKNVSRGEKYDAKY